MKTFNGRVVAPGTVTAEAVVSHVGLNTLATFQKALQFGDKNATCGDQNNQEAGGDIFASKGIQCQKETDSGQSTQGQKQGIPVNEISVDDKSNSIHVCTS